MSAASAWERAEAFATEWQALTGRVRLGRTADGALSELLDELREIDARRVAIWDDPRNEDVGLEPALTAAGIAALRWGRDVRSGAEVADVDAGITWADGAVASTGSVLLRAGSGQGRSVSLLPPVYFVLVRADEIAVTRGELLRKLTASGKPMPSAATFVTGPSRTADIEMDLAVGVHGPGRVTAIILP